MARINKPCWYHNNEGCTKSADECIYQHVHAPGMRKPLHLQHPCYNFHVRNNGVCNTRNCQGDHHYKLTQVEWAYHFPHIPYKKSTFRSPPGLAFPVVKQHLVNSELEKLKNSFLDKIDQLLMT